MFSIYLPSNLTYQTTPKISQSWKLAPFLIFLKGHKSDVFYLPTYQTVPKIWHKVTSLAHFLFGKATKVTFCIYLPTKPGERFWQSWRFAPVLKAHKNGVLAVRFSPHKDQRLGKRARQVRERIAGARARARERGRERSSETRVVRC